MAVTQTTAATTTTFCAIAFLKFPFSLNPRNNLPHDHLQVSSYTIVVLSLAVIQHSLCNLIVFPNLFAQAYW